MAADFFDGWHFANPSDKPFDLTHDGVMKTDDDEYAFRLHSAESAWWKRAFNVQAPYQRNIRRHRLGRTLDIGCGIGRNLGQLDAGSVGVDHNATSVRIARERGLSAMTTDQFLASDLAQPESFDGILLAHVIEHLTPESGRELMTSYVRFLRPGGKVLFICPQERGYASDPTHIRWTTFRDLEQLSEESGLIPVGRQSFPLPRWAGKAFTYNEFNVLARKP